MAISVISGAASALAGKSAGASSTLQGGAAGFDFASLLGSQLADSTAGGLTALLGTDVKTKTEDEPAPVPAELMAQTVETPVILPGLPIVPAPAVPTAPDKPGLAEHAGLADATSLSSIQTPVEWSGDANTPEFSRLAGIGEGKNPSASIRPEQGGTAEPSKVAPSTEDGLSAARASAARTPAQMVTTEANRPATAGDTAILAAEASSQPSGAGEAQPNFASMLAAQAPQQTQAPVRTERPSNLPEIPTPLGDGRWAQDFGDKVVWMAKSDIQSAQININPPQLGPMQITLNIAGDQATASFASPHAEVRQAIADAMPQLRDMLAGAGINLGQSNVGAQLPQQQQNAWAQQQAFQGNAARSGDDKAILQADAGGTAAIPASAIQRGRGMVDLFA